MPRSENLNSPTGKSIIIITNKYNKHRIINKQHCLY